MKIPETTLEKATALDLWSGLWLAVKMTALSICFGAPLWLFGLMPVAESTALGFLFLIAQTVLKIFGKDWSVAESKAQVLKSHLSEAMAALSIYQSELEKAKAQIEEAKGLFDANQDLTQKLQAQKAKYERELTAYKQKVTALKAQAKTPEELTALQSEAAQTGFFDCLRYYKAKRSSAAANQGSSTYKAATAEMNKLEAIYTTELPTE